MIYKRFNHRKWLDPFLTYFRPTRAWQSWQAGQHLASRAIPTPQNLAFIARLRPFGRSLFWYLPHETYLITIKAEPARSRSATTSSESCPARARAEQRVRMRRLTLALARLLRTLHERSISDRDLKTSNILIVGDPDVRDAAALDLIDLVGVHLIHPLPEHRRIQNLARLQREPGRGAGPDPDRRPAVPPGVPALGPLAAQRLEGALAGDRRGAAAKEDRNRRRGRRLS